MFYVNDLIKLNEVDGQEQIERILWVDEGAIICYTIDVEKPNALPQKRKLSELQSLYDDQILTFEKEDSYNFIYQDESQLSEKSKKLRDERWSVIGTIANFEPDIYQSSIRGRLIRQEMVRLGKGKNQFYKFLTQYWQRGKVKNALLPDYHRSGGRGREKNFKDKKNGRSKKFSDTFGEGIVITNTIKQIFEVSVKKFYHTAKNNNLKFTYDQMIRTFFHDGFHFENGIKKPILRDRDELPSYRQFQYWYKKKHRTEEKLRARKGDRKYELEDRAILGTSVGELYGPGTKFQIDATIANVYLVSSYNRNWIIGRPVIYVVIDAFSRMVTGLYVGLEGPSWLGSMMALANTASDKVSYCDQYGIKINQADWPCHHLPQTLLADRGEIEGYNIERLTNAFNMNVENTPPFRADWKGIVEQHFNTLDGQIKPFVPGSVDTDVRIRGERDYRLDATLTLEEFTQIIIHCVLHHNNHHWLLQYDPSEMMIQEELPLIPSKIWEWGIKNRSGKLKTFPESIVKMHLLPTGNANVTGKGIEFKGMRYSSQTAISKRWFNDARHKTWSIPVSYDPRNMSQIYIPNTDGSKYEVASLLEHQKKHRDKTLEEVENAFLQKEFQHQKYEHTERQLRSNKDSEIEHIIKKAEKSFKKEAVNISNNQRLKGIRQHKLDAKEANRKEEAFLLGTNDIENSSNSIQQITGKEQIDETLATNSKVDWLRQKQKEKMQHVKNRKQDRESL